MPTRRHGVVVGALYYCGFFLLFCCLGTFGSAGFLSYRAMKWTLTNAQVHDCSLGAYPLHKEPKMYDLHCGITYQIAGRSYKNFLQTRFTRSIQERDAIKNWIANNRGDTVVVRVNPSYPDQFVVQSRLPGKRGRDPEDYADAGIVLGSVSLLLLAGAHLLAGRGW